MLVASIISVFIIHLSAFKQPFDAECGEVRLQGSVLTTHLLHEFLVVKDAVDFVGDVSGKLLLFGFLLGGCDVAILPKQSFALSLTVVSVSLSRENFS